MQDALRRDDELLWMVSSYMPAFLIRAALRLGLVEAMGDAVMTSSELARATSAHEPSLIRMLRALAAIGLLAEEEPGLFRLSPRGQLLRPGVAGSLHGVATVMLDESMWGAWPALDHAVRTGQPAFEHVYGTDYMTHVGWDDGSELREMIDLLIIDETRVVARAVVAAYDFAPYSTVVDLGGGSGPLVAAVLATHPHLRGTVFDRAEGVAHAPRVLADAGVADRCEIRTGDFFDSVPAADLYLCKSVIFNWADDERVARIFANTRRAIADTGRLLLLEKMLPPTVDGSMPPHVYVDDLNSIVSLGGRLRTEPEYQALLDAAGFTLDVHPLPAAPDGYVLLEARPR